MKVVFFNSSKKWGGGEKWHAEMAFSLKNEGITPIGITHKKSMLFQKFDEAEIALIPIKINSLSFLNPFKIIQLIKLFGKLKADVIIMNLPTDLKSAGFAARLAGIKRIIYRRGSAIPIKNKWTNRLIFKYLVTDIIVNSKETARTILANNANLFPANKIQIIYNGIKTDVYFKNHSEGNLTENKSNLVLGNLARLSYQKGQHMLVDLAEKLLLNGIEVKILIGGEGELESELKMLVAKRGLQQVIEFCGFVTDPYAFMNKIDIFVFPSIWEGFGYSIVEAKLAKKPIVAFSVSSNPEIIQDTIDGFLVPLNDIDSFYEATLKLIKNVELRKTMGEAGRIDVLKRFTHERSVKDLLEFLA